MYYAERWRERQREIERQVCVVCVLCIEMERETEGDREAGVWSVCIMQRDGERQRERDRGGAGVFETDE